ncbi:hypothetical protein JCGZ_01165 [Jatropha curcas]|uniref:Uncharacterized protein n=1 Tax=Jatropha curcas TaxID=180498 RepID=A0A067JSU8_JATCU|nr:hypothetical protein JCGZ_01165 [Jatropha curcas]
MLDNFNDVKLQSESRPTQLLHAIIFSEMIPAMGYGGRTHRSNGERVTIEPVPASYGTELAQLMPKTNSWVKIELDGVKSARCRAAMVFRPP